MIPTNLSFSFCKSPGEVEDSSTVFKMESCYDFVPRYVSAAGLVSLWRPTYQKTSCCSLPCHLSFILRSLRYAILSLTYTKAVTHFSSDNCDAFCHFPSCKYFMSQMKTPPLLSHLSDEQQNTLSYFDTISSTKCWNWQWLKPLHWMQSIHC